MAIRIDASGDDLRRTANLPLSSGLTVCGWAYIVTDRGVGTYQALAVLENTALGTYDGLYWEASTDGSMTVESNIAAANMASRPGTGAWFFWAMTSTTAGAGSFIGYQSAATTNTFTTVSTTGAAILAPDRLTIGNDSAGSWSSARFSGIKIWDVVLTQAQLEQEKWSYVPRYTASSNGWYPGRIAPEVYDFSGLGRNLTATGTLTTEDGPPVSWGGASYLYPYTAPAAGGADVRNHIVPAFYRINA